MSVRISALTKCKLCSNQLNPSKYDETWGTYLEQIAMWHGTGYFSQHWDYFGHISCLQQCSMPSCSVLFHPKSRSSIQPMDLRIMEYKSSPLGRFTLDYKYSIIQILPIEFSGNAFSNSTLYLPNKTLASTALVCLYCKEKDTAVEAKKVADAAAAAAVLAAAEANKVADAAAAVAAEKKAKEDAAAVLAAAEAKKVAKAAAAAEAKKVADAAAEKKAKEERKKERKPLAAAKVHMELITSYIEGVFPKYVILLITQVFGETENKDNLVDILLSFLYSKPKIESNQNWSDPAAINYLKEQMNILLSIYTISEKENVPLTNILSVVVDNRLLFVDEENNDSQKIKEAPIKAQKVAQITQPRKIGIVEHQYSDTSVAAINLTQNISIGDRIGFRQTHAAGVFVTDMFGKMVIQSMEINSVSVEQSIAGNSVGIQIPPAIFAQLRLDDIVFQLPHKSSPKYREFSTSVDYGEKTVAELKHLLKAAGKPVSGKKSDLVTRLSYPNFSLSSTANEDNKNVFTSTSWDGFNEDSLVRIANLERWLESVETECLFEGIFSYPQKITYDKAVELLDSGFEKHPEALIEVVFGGAHWEIVAVKHGFYQL